MIMMCGRLWRQMVIILCLMPALVMAKPSLKGVGQIKAGNKTCVATLIANDTLLTAAHCLFNDKHKQYISPKNMAFILSPNASRGFTVKKYTVGVKTFPKGSFDEQHLYGDWAIVTLNKPVGCDVGQFEFNWDKKVTSDRLAVIKYTKDTVENPVIERQCQYALPPSNKRMLRLKSCKLQHGDSGGPLMVEHQGKLQVVGLISAGAYDSKKRYRVIAVPAEAFKKHVTGLNTRCNKSTK